MHDKSRIAALLAAAKAGDKAAQWDIVQSFEPLMKKLLQREKDPLQQEDLRQDLALGILEALHRFAGDPAVFPGYVKQSLINLMGLHTRRMIRDRQLRDNLAAAEIPVYEEPAYEMRDKAQEKILRAKMQQACRRLSPQEKQLLSHRLRSRPLSWDALGEMFATYPMDTFRRYQKILQKIRTALE